MDGWIRVEDELPDDGLAVLMFSPDDCTPVWISFLDGGEWMDADGSPLLHEVTHWMNLPEPPVLVEKVEAA